MSFAGMIIRVEDTGLSQQAEGILQTAIDSFLNETTMIGIR
ncbi:hypothetical protein RV03_GL002075 [Enterococcus gallinarum]|nr:hypothetical protein RV03_GL002075 [Enterococcus gallinarum]